MRNPTRKFELIVFAAFLIGVLSIAPLSAQQSIKVTLLKAFENHKNSLFTLALSPDGKYLVSAGVDRKVILWDVKSWEPVAVSKEGTGRILHLRFSRDGKYVFATNDPKSIRILAVPDMKETRTIDLPFRPVRVAISPKRNIFAVSGGGDQAKSFNSISGKEQATFSGQKKNNQAICFSELSIYIAGEMENGKGRLTSSPVVGADRKERLGDFKGRPNRLKFNTDGDLYLVASNEACIVDPNNGKRLQTWTSTRSADFLSITHWPDHQMYITSDREGFLNFWSVGNDKPIGEFRISRTSAHDVLPIGSEHLVTATQQARRSLKLWKIEISRSITNTPDNSPPPVPKLAKKMEYEITKPLNLVSIANEQIRVVGSSENAEQVGVAFESGRFSTFDMRREKKLVDANLRNTRVAEITFVPSRDSIYVRTGSELYWLTTSTGIVRKSYQAELGFIPGKSSLAFNSRNIAIPAAGGLELVSTSFRGGARLLATAARNKTDRLFSATAFSRNSDFVAGACLDGTIFFWKGDPLIGETGRTTSYDPIGSLKQPRERVLDLQFHDGNLASISESGVLRVWSPEGKLKAKHSFGDLKLAAFQRDGQVAFVTKDSPSVLQIYRFGDDETVKPTLVTSFYLNAGLPERSKVSVASMHFRRDGKRLALGLNSTNETAQQCFVAIYRTEK